MFAPIFFYFSNFSSCSIELRFYIKIEFCFIYFFFLLSNNFVFPIRILMRSRFVYFISWQKCVSKYFATNILPACKEKCNVLNCIYAWINNAYRNNFSMLDIAVGSINNNWIIIKLSLTIYSLILLSNNKWSIKLFFFLKIGSLLLKNCGNCILQIFVRFIESKSILLHYVMHTMKVLWTQNWFNIL
jgi:hypothetical protein